MDFEHDDESLALTVSLAEGEPGDLTQGELGRLMLDATVSGMEACFRDQADPDGNRWAPLRHSTIRNKKHDIAGVQTGLLLVTVSVGGRFDIAPRRARWSFPRREAFARALAFQTGGPHQSPRPFVGWTARAQAECRRLLTDHQAEDARRAAAADLDQAADQLADAAARAESDLAAGVTAAAEALHSTAKSVVPSISTLFRFQEE